MPTSENTLPKVSVVVPVFNAEEHLEECLESLLNQTLGGDLEIVAVNDGSTDRSFDLLKKNAKNDKRIRLIDKKNRGYGHTMNVGIAESRGEYVGILEADDLVETDKYSILYEIAKNNEDPDIVKAEFYEFFPSIKRIVPARTIPADKTGIKLDPARNPDLFENFIAVWSSIYRNDYLKSNDLTFLETPGASYQDIGFFYKTLGMARSVVLCDKPLHYYRSDNQKSSIKDPGKIFCVCDEWKEIDRFYKCFPEQKQKLGAVLYKGKMISYVWNYDRLKKERKRIFLDCMTEEFKRDKDLSNFDFSLFSQGEKEFWDFLASLSSKENNSVSKIPNIDFFEQRLGKLNESDGFAIFGTGRSGLATLEYLNKTKRKVEYFLDNDPERRAKFFHGVPVLPPEQGNISRKTPVLIAVQDPNFFAEIDRQLEQLGFEQRLPIPDLFLCMIFEDLFSFS